MLLLVINVFALDELSTIGEDNRKVLDRVLKYLDLDSTSKYSKSKIYKKFDYALKKNWYLTFLHNKSLSNSKVSDSDTKFLVITIVDERNIFDITLIHFKKQKQLQIITKQYISGKGKLLLEKFEELKKDKKNEVVTETDNYAYLQEKGYVSDSIISIINDFGMIVYIDMSKIDL